MQFEEILSICHKYYPASLTQTNEMFDIIGKKHTNELPLKQQWDKFTLQLSKDTNYSFENIDFYQFPSLVLKINDTIEVNDIKICKRFTFCISLLGNCYTYYYDYFHRKKMNQGSITLDGVSFLDDDNFDELKLDFDLNYFLKLVNTNFGTYRYINHFTVMNYKFPNAVPYGYGDNEAHQKAFSIYELLFEHQNGNQKITY